MAGEVMRYEKGRKDASRRRILEVASDRFRSDGIAATGLASIMTDAGLTNGAFYPHFQSKADLVRETVASTLERQAELLRETLDQEGVEAVIAAYLSPAHRDNAAGGCTFAAVLPELARQPLEARSVYAERLVPIARELASALPQHIENREAVAMSLYATLIGTLQLARAVEGTELSDRILAAGADAARAVAGVG
jgi:TetR/AcrR family transcriptional repressor of nem operon